LITYAGFIDGMPSILRIRRPGVRIFRGAP
jgi:hypothetical protein